MLDFNEFFEFDSHFTFRLLRTRTLPRSMALAASQHSRSAFSVLFEYVSVLQRLKWIQSICQVFKDEGKTVLEYDGPREADGIVDYVKGAQVRRGFRRACYAAQPVDTRCP